MTEIRGLAAKMAEPADGTMLVAVNNFGDPLVIKRNDEVASFFRDARGGPATARWIIASGGGSEPLTWENVLIRLGAQAVYPVGSTPLATL